ncbi:MAG: hypothetical protein K6T63_12950 [Alicyclobacillus herbarius]|uniref:hypothetical protein n=1 Tax=Alicyclobacillus herbarius TaxID=122960 RepID=UPI002353DB8C|nr:hypothetical protein [Alicyclobacillus herbarius]MCL6633525.1 hypothetical protein [Alicyclobacillus herbarius]
MLVWLKTQGFVAYYDAHLAGHAGLRLEEVCGLRWSDVQWDANIIEIRRTRQRDKRQDVVLEPKTADSVGDVVLSDAAMAELPSGMRINKRLRARSVYHGPMNSTSLFFRTYLARIRTHSRRV